MPTTPSHIAASDEFANGVVRICVIVVGLILLYLVRQLISRSRHKPNTDHLRRQLDHAQQQVAAPAPILPTTTSTPTRPLPTSPSTPSSSPAIPEVGAFAPLSDDQIRNAAAGINLWQSPLFGRRDIIPPTSDPRTALIDNGMVGHGFITPEELVEIHRIGDKMESIKPDLGLIAAKTAAAADQAVQQTLEDRRRLKEQKKAEAAERKRLHQQAVAHRKATDILYLGRGVSKGLADRQSDTAKLTAANLPLLATPADIAAALNLTIPRLRWLAFHADAATRSHYVRFTVPKRSGGHRHLFAPHKSLAAAQEWILRNILDHVPTHAAAHGFVKGRSTVTNATPHVDRDVVLNADLQDFFPTITFPRVLGLFKQLGYSPAAATILALLCTEPPRRVVVYAGKTFHVATGPRALPQGACTSPALSNLTARRLDSRLNGIASKLNYRYTRYADDLTFSALSPLPGIPGEGSGEGLPPQDSTNRIGYLLARIRHIAQDEGFLVNEKKTRVLKRAARQEVTGVVVNKRPGVPRPTYKRLRAILHRAKHEGLPAQNRQNLPHFEAWLKGMIAYVSMVNPKQGESLKNALAQLKN